MVTLHTIDGGTVNAINDALLYDFIIGQNGIATGATVTSEGALLLHIDSGWGVIKGRIFSIEAETVSATPSTSGTVKGRLILQIDITNTTNPITFVTQAAATLPALQQEDINNAGTIFQLPIATYDVNEVAISNLQMTAPVVEAIKGRIDSAQNTATARGTLAQTNSNSLNTLPLSNMFDIGSSTSFVYNIGVTRGRFIVMFLYSPGRDNISGETPAIVYIQTNVDGTAAKITHNGPEYLISVYFVGNTLQFNFNQQYVKGFMLIRR